MDRSRLQARTDQNVVEIRLRRGSAAIGRTLEELQLPSRCLIASIRRGGRVLIPRGDTRLEAGDIVVALIPEGKEATLRAELVGADNQRPEARPR